MSFNFLDVKSGILFKADSVIFDFLSFFLTNTPHHFSLWRSSTWSNFMCASFRASLTLVGISKYDESKYLQHGYFLHSKTSLWILQLAASRSFFGGWGTSISPHETGRYRTVLLPCDVETLDGTADTVALGWSDKKHTMRGLSLWWIARWTMGGCALLAVCAVTAFLPASRQGARWLLPFSSAAFVVAPQGYFWKACGGKRISK